MKRTLIALAAAAMLAVPITGAIAPAAQAVDMKVGTIDVQRILAGSSLMKALEAAQKEVAEAEKRLADEYERRRKELAEKQGKVSDDEFTKLKRKFEDEMASLQKGEQEKLGKKRDDIRRMKETLEKDVEVAVNKVAGAKGLDLVIHKQLVIFGGTDITKEVLDALPKR